MRRHFFSSAACRTAGLSALLVIGLAVALPGDADAQYHRYAAGFTAGGSLITDLNPGAPGDALSLTPDAGFVLGLHGDRWYGPEGRFGIRYQGAYQRPTFDWAQGERRIGAVSADVGALIRLTPPGNEATALPFISGGFGGLWYDLGTGDPTTFEDADAFHDGGSRVLPLVMVGAGVDVDVPWDWQGAPVRLRVEVSDHMTFGSPIRQASDGARYGQVHHFRLSLGLHSIFDLRR